MSGQTVYIVEFGSAGQMRIMGVFTRKDRAHNYVDAHFGKSGERAYSLAAYQLDEKCISSKVARPDKRK